MSTLSLIDSLTVKLYVIGWGERKQKTRHTVLLLIRCGSRQAMRIFHHLLHPQFHIQRCEKDEFYLAHMNVIAKTANEKERLVWMCGNRWLPPSFPWCWAHRSFSSFTLISHNNLSFDHKHKLLSSETSTSHSPTQANCRTQTQSCSYLGE